MQDASKLNWALKSFPKEDFRGFWICYSTKNLLSNDTKISFLQIFSGFNPISTGLLRFEDTILYWQNRLTFVISVLFSLL